MTTLPPFLTDRRGFAARGSRGPAAFTLVELLVVIAILAMLMALLVPTVMRSLAKARVAALKAEIDMLHMAIMNYKNEYGSLPPCNDPNVAAGSPAAKHLARLFPRCTNVASQFTTVQPPLPPLTPATAIAYWLGGYTDDPTHPLTGGDRKRLYDFDRARISSGGQYHPSKLPGSPYVYIPSDAYGQTFTIGGSTYAALRTPVSAAAPNLTNPAQPAFNPDTFQILCAGKDEQFGTGDDLSNFWPGTRQDYLDTLK